MSQNGSQNGGKIAPKSDQMCSEGAFGFRRVPENESKIDSKMEAQREPNGSPIGSQNRVKNVLKNEVAFREGPGAPQGRKRSQNGANMQLKLSQKLSKFGVELGLFLYVFGILVGRFWVCLWQPFRNIIE